MTDGYSTGGWAVGDEPPGYQSSEAAVAAAEAMAKKAEEAAAKRDQKDAKVVWKLQRVLQRVLQGHGKGKAWNGPQPSEHLKAWCDKHKVRGRSATQSAVCVCARAHTCLCVWVW